MLTVKKLLAALEGLDLDAQVVVGIIDGPRFNAAYAEQRVCATADVDGDHHLALQDTAAPTLYICCYEQPRPWEGKLPRLNEDGTSSLEYDPDDENPHPGKEP